MIRIVTDSGANLPSDVRAKYNIGIVPLLVIFGNKTYRDEVDLSHEQFYRMLRQEKILPTTSTPAPTDFIEVWRPILDAGDEIVSIHLPSGLSATFASAVNAKSQLESERGGNVPITLVDSKWVSMAMGFQALEGARAAVKGASVDQIVQAMTALDPRLSALFLLDTLEYLRRGGRIGNAQAFLGAMFHIKPLLQIRNAGIEPLERARSRKAGLKRLVELVNEPPTNGEGILPIGTGALHIAIMHADAPDDAQYLANEIRARFNIAEMYSGQIGPAIGVHGGPQLVGAVFYRE
jgi:DegV family protein with EDD domain